MSSIFEADYFSLLLIRIDGSYHEATIVLSIWIRGKVVIGLTSFYRKRAFKIATNRVEILGNDLLVVAIGYFLFM
jgi:hypothetical protein